MTYVEIPIISDIETILISWPSEQPSVSTQIFQAVMNQLQLIAAVMCVAAWLFRHIMIIEGSLQQARGPGGILFPILIEEVGSAILILEQFHPFSP